MLVAKYETALFTFLLRVLGQRELARDMCQEAFLKAFKGLPGFRVGSPFKPWLYRVALNTARSHQRRPFRRELGMDLVPEPSASMDATGVRAPISAHTRLEDRAQNDAVLAALAALPEDHREAVVLRFVEDFSYEQMADVLGVGVSALKMRVHRGLQRLRELMETQGAGGGGAK